jgi:hypothetical protein
LAFDAKPLDEQRSRKHGKGDVHGLVTYDEGDQQPLRIIQQAADGRQNGKSLFLHLMEMKGCKRKEGRL